MAKVVHRHETKIQKVPSGDGTVLPNFQSFATLGHKEWVTLPYSGTPPSNAWSSAPKTIYYDLEPQDCKSVEMLYVRLKVSASGGDIQLVGAPYLFSSIECRSNKGSGKRIFEILPEQMVAWPLLTLNEECQDTLAKLGNYALTDIKSQNLKKYWYNDSNYIRDGESRYITFPIPINFIQLGALDLRHVKSPIRFIFHTSSDVVINGSVSNLSLDGLDFLVTGHNESDFDATAGLSLAQKQDNAYHFLTCERYIVNDKTLTAGETTEIYLDNFVGKSPYLMICIKNTTTPQASDGSLFDYLDIGKDATITMENTSGRDLISQGNPIRQEQMYLHLNEQLARKPYKGMHFLCFSENIREAQSGAIPGYYQFNGTRLKLVIKFDNAPTSEVHSISLGTTASANTYYRYAFENAVKGLSDQDAESDDTTNDLLSIINAMPCLADRGWSASAVSNNINTSATHNVTFSNTDGRISDELGKLTLLGAPVKVNSTSVSTFGDDGWITGSSYEISIFCFKYSKFVVTKEGDLDVEEL